MSFPIVRMFLSERPNSKALISSGRHLLFSSSEVSETRDLSYGPQERHKLDIYEPADITDETDLIVFLHGGGWETGNKEMHKFIGRSWARKNFIMVLPNYRLVPEATYPDQLRDVMRSLLWLQRNYGNYDGSLYLAGHSAGAHMAAMTGFSESWLEKANLDPGDIAGFILLAGVYQFFPYNKADVRVKRFVGDEHLWDEAQPINHLGRNLSPVFIAHGSEDIEVWPEQSYQLSKKLEERGVKNELFIDEGAGHLELLLATSARSSCFWEELLDFIR